MDQDRLEFNQALLKAARRVDPDFAKTSKEIRLDNSPYDIHVSDDGGTIWSLKKDRKKLMRMILRIKKTNE